MAGYNMSLKADDPMSVNGSHTQYITTQPQLLHSNMDGMALGIDLGGMSVAGMVPNTMSFNDNSMALGNMSFTNPYNMATSFTTSMPHMTHVDHEGNWSNYGNIPMVPMNSIHMRSDSLSSLESCPPLIKSEEEFSPLQPSQIFYNTPAYSSPDETSSPATPEDSKSSSFSTDVDTLMKAIQSKVSKPAQPREQVLETRCILGNSTSDISQPTPQSSPERVYPSKPRKRYQCPLPDCNKSFYQKTHLEIHTRAHTGVKPFVSTCKHLPCVLF